MIKFLFSTDFKNYNANNRPPDTQKNDEKYECTQFVFT